MLPSVVFSTILLTSVVWAQIPDQFTSGFKNNTISLVVTYGANEVTDGEKLSLNGTFPLSSHFPVPSSPRPR